MHQAEQKGMPYAYALLDTVPAYLRIGKTKEAHVNAKKAFDIFMRTRDENFVLLDAVDKEHFLRSSSRFIVYLIEAEQAYGGDYAERIATFNAWLRYKGSIFDSENILSVVFGNTKDEALRQKMKRLSGIKRSLAVLYQNKHMPPKERTQNIRHLQRESIRISGELTQQIDALRLLHQYQSITGETVAESLEPDELYVDFAQVAENYVVFVASPDKTFRMRFIPVKEATRITKTIFAVKAKLDNGDEPAKKDLSYLYDVLLGKTLDDVKLFKGKTNLVLSPDGPLHLIPFEMLYDSKKKRYLVQERNLRYVPNAKELLRLKARKQENAHQDIVLFDHPDFNIPDGVAPSGEDNATRAIKLRIAFAPLPGTKKEAEAIKKIMKDHPVTEYADKNATEENLLAVHHPKILHLSTHGFFSKHASPPNPMLRSHIALAGANYAYTTGKGNGIVSALKLSGLDLKGTDLVVVSACQTGVMDPEATDSISGLSKAFIEAGAKDVVVSLWSVSDMGTMMLMKYFYQGIHDGQGYAEALRNAKLKMIKKGAPVSIWAPFILNGV